MKKILIIFFCLNAFLSALYSESIILSPDVTEQMLETSFWTKKIKQPFKIGATLKEIDQWNKNACSVQYCMEDRNPPVFVMSYEDLRKIPASMSAYEIRKASGISPKTDYYRKNKNGTIYKLKNSDWKKIWGNMNFSKIYPQKEWFLQNKGFIPSDGKYYKIKKAVTVRRTNIRLIPDDGFYTNDPEYWFDDMMQNSGILMNEPVLVLWTSANKKWYLIRTSFCTGWVHAEDVALCNDEQFERYFDFVQQPQDSIAVITVDRVQLTKDYFIQPEKTFNNCPEFSMGTVVHLAQWNHEIKSRYGERIPYNSYLAEIPYRKKDGTLATGYCAVPASLCSRGFLSYTRENVIKLAMQTTGYKYGWGGMDSSRDCTEFTKDIYRCFGFTLPRNSRFQIAMPGKAFRFNEETTIEEKKKIIDSLEPGTFMAVKGHVFIYLGSENGKYYVISQMGAFYNENSPDIINVNSANINTLDIFRKKGSWLDNLEVCNTLECGDALFENEIPLKKEYKFSEFSKIHDGKAVLYKASEKVRKNIVVAVNAGHGTTGGSKQKTYSHPDKTPKVTGGTNASGAVESIAVSGGMVFKNGEWEHEVNYRVARIAKNRLLSLGYDVLMIRDWDDVQLDNVARTVIANNNADIHVAIHYDGDSKKEDKGIFWCSIPEGVKKLETVKKHFKQSERLGKCFIKAAEEMGLKIFGEGTLEVDLTQTCYSTIPTVDIELGNQSSLTDYVSCNQRADMIVQGIEKFFSN